MIETGLVIATLAGLAGFAVTLLLLANARRLGIVQSPNARSSHQVPTPSGGGVGIVAGGTLAGLPAAMLAPWPTLLVLAAALLIAAIGLLDDRASLGVRMRLLAQVALTSAVVLAVPLDTLRAQLGLPFPEPLLATLLVVAGVGWINIFNFMDGIDGIAGSEAMFMLLGAGLLALVGVPGVLDQPAYWWMLGLAASVLGFLLLNWAPARIFMGDAGSTYLGLMLGFFALASMASGWLSLWQWLILAATFVADGFVTLVRRLLQGERIWEAHRRHAYQVLQRRFGSHAKATLLYVGINVVWLLPLAWLAGAIGPWGWLAAVAAYGVLVPAALIAGAGRP